MSIINTHDLMMNDFLKRIQEGYEATFGHLNHHYIEIMSWAGRSALEIISNGDALYHDVEHTIQVSLVGQEILRGKHISEGGITSEDWLHAMISFFCHDIGYVKGICKKDDLQEGIFATGKDQQTVQLGTGITDASLTPYHVDRGKLFIDERFGGHKLICADVIKANIENTRFPVPETTDKMLYSCYPGIVRSADLIGQLSDPRYLQKVPALFYEFEETGTNEKLGYKSPGQLRDEYPNFYWNVVHKFIKQEIEYLNVTQSGRQICNNLLANVFRAERKLQLADKAA